MTIMNTRPTLCFVITIKVAIDFIQSNGLDYIIQVPKGSRAAAAVSVCLYYLAFNNDAMERLNQYPEYKLDRVVDYTLDLIETKPGFTPLLQVRAFVYRGYARGGILVQKSI